MENSEMRMSLLLRVAQDDSLVASGMLMCGFAK